MNEEVFYLAIDPGETSGWASFKKDGTPIDFGQVRQRLGVYDLLKEQQPKFLVVEDFELFPWKSKEQSFSQFETVRVIGAIEFWAWAKAVPIVLQKPRIKPIAYKWAGLTPQKNHSLSHGPDAYVHGVYYLQSNGILKPQQLRSK